jgi:hypothetical protein
VATQRVVSSSICLDLTSPSLSLFLPCLYLSRCLPSASLSLWHCLTLSASRANYGPICCYHHVDSQTGSGIQELRKDILKYSLQQPWAVQRVPKIFKKLETGLKELGNHGRFSLTRNEYLKYCSEVFKIDEESSLHALGLFHTWGIVHVLSLGDIVLEPQKLALVLSPYPSFLPPPHGLSLSVLRSCPLPSPTRLRSSTAWVMESLVFSAMTRSTWSGKISMSHSVHSSFKCSMTTNSPTLSLTLEDSLSLLPLSPPCCLMIPLVEDSHPPKRISSNSTSLSIV